MVLEYWINILHALKLFYMCTCMHMKVSRYQLQTSVLCGEELGVCVWGFDACVWTAEAMGGRVLQ